MLLETAVDDLACPDCSLGIVILQAQLQILTAEDFLYREHCVDAVPQMPGQPIAYCPYCHTHLSTVTEWHWLGIVQRCHYHLWLHWRVGLDYHCGFGFFVGLDYHCGFAFFEPFHNCLDALGFASDLADLSETL